MTFEEWWESRRGPNSSFQSKDWAEKDVYKAKEDTKEYVTLEWSELVEDWSVRDFRGAAIEDGFTSKEAAQSWAEFKGYRVE